MYTPSASRCLRSAGRYLTISPILNLWGISFPTRDLIHERNDTAWQSGPYVHKRLRQAPSWLVTNSHIGRRRSATVGHVRASHRPLEKERHRDAKNISSL